MSPQMKMNVLATTCNPKKYWDIYGTIGTIESSVDCQKSSNINVFHDTKLRQSKRQAPSLINKILTEKEFEEDLLGTFKYKNKRCECSNYLLINNYSTFRPSKF